MRYKEWMEYKKEQAFLEILGRVVFGHLGRELVRISQAMGERLYCIVLKCIQ
jgi:hypothetical protein